MTHGAPILQVRRSDERFQSEKIVTYATLMVHLELGNSNTSVLQIAGDLAEQFNARVVGIAAGQPMQIVYSSGLLPGEICIQDRDEISKELHDAEAEFVRELQPRSINISWRAAMVYESLAEYLAIQSRCADLVISRTARIYVFDASRTVDTADLVMRLGRPVLVVPSAERHLSLKRVLVCWKDTREARRAVFDALPILKQAAQVTIVEIADEKEMPATHGRIADVVDWLKQHGIVGTPVVLPSTRDDTQALCMAAQSQNADVIVAGAYGHSRLREWVLGGVTRDLLLSDDRCSLLSH